MDPNHYTWGMVLIRLQRVLLRYHIVVHNTLTAGRKRTIVGISESALPLFGDFYNTSRTRQKGKKTCEKTYFGMCSERRLPSLPT